MPPPGLDSDPVADALFVYLKQSVQYGLRVRPDFWVSTADGQMTIPRDEIEFAVELEDDRAMKRRMQLLLALGPYRDQLARERHHEFAGEFGASRWADVSRSWFPKILWEFSENLLARRKRAQDDPFRWDDCELEWRVLSLDVERDLYVLRSEYRMTITAEDLVVAQSDDEELAEGICRIFPEVIEIFTPETGGRCELTMSVRESVPGARWRTLKYHRDRALYEGLVRERPDAVASGIAFWRSESLGDLRRIEVRLRCDWEVKFSWNYFQWSAPHSVWLRSFEADLAAFRPAMDGRSLTLLRTTQDGRRAVVDQEQLTCRLDLENELSAGQSIRVEWGVA